MAAAREKNKKKKQKENACLSENKNKTKNTTNFIELLESWRRELVSILIAHSCRLWQQRQQREHEMCNELWQPQRFIEAQPRPGLLTKLLNKRPTAMDSGKCIAFWSNNPQNNQQQQQQLTATTITKRQVNNAELLPSE